MNRMIVSPDTYALRLLGKILFAIVLPISGGCQSMVYRSVPLLKYSYLYTLPNKTFGGYIVFALSVSASVHLFVCANVS